jgi:hypothetical protein
MNRRSPYLRLVPPSKKKAPRFQVHYLQHCGVICRCNPSTGFQNSDEYSTTDAISKRRPNTNSFDNNHCFCCMITIMNLFEEAHNGKELACPALVCFHSTQDSRQNIRIVTCMKEKDTATFSRPSSACRSDDAHQKMNNRHHGRSRMHEP